MTNREAALSLQALFLHTISVSASAVQKSPAVFLILLQNDLAADPEYELVQSLFGVIHAFVMELNMQPDLYISQ